MDGHSVPTRSHRGYAGGHAELHGDGVTTCRRCDVEGSTPRSCFRKELRPAGHRRAYLPMLAELTRRRLEAKAESRRAVQAGQEAERAMGGHARLVQGSHKLVYGYLSYGGGLFNDYDAAERVTLAGQRIVKTSSANPQLGGQRRSRLIPTASFVPPADVHELTLSSVHRRGATNLPAGIRLSHDGRYAAMLSLRLKTCALLSYDGTMTLKEAPSQSPHGAISTPVPCRSRSPLT